LVNQFAGRLARVVAIIAQLSPIQLQKPADLIMRQIRTLLSSGALKAGDRLPPERELASQFGVGRGHVREALRKLEFYGVLQTFRRAARSSQAWVRARWSG